MRVSTITAAAVAAGAATTLRILHSGNGSKSELAVVGGKHAYLTSPVGSVVLFFHDRLLLSLSDNCAPAPFSRPLVTTPTSKLRVVIPVSVRCGRMQRSRSSLSHEFFPRSVHKPFVLLAHRAVCY
jgi:hypothetical protein